MTAKLFRTVSIFHSSWSLGLYLTLSFSSLKILSILKYLSLSWFLWHIFLLFVPQMNLPLSFYKTRVLWCLVLNCCLDFSSQSIHFPGQWTYSFCRDDFQIYKSSLRLPFRLQNYVLKIYLSVSLIFQLWCLKDTSIQYASNWIHCLCSITESLLIFFNQLNPTRSTGE